MSKRLAFLHVLPALATTFNELAVEVLPEDVALFHIVDEVLLHSILVQGGLSPAIVRRVIDHVTACEEAGMDAVQFTSTTISDCARVATSMVGIPVLTIDQPMVDQAVRLGSRIGVVVTAHTTIEPTTNLVYARAEAAGESVEVDLVFCEGAYDALFAGEVETHDRIVLEAVRKLMARNEVVILAQASMARLAEAIPSEERTVPILSSPRPAMQRARRALENA